MKILVTGGAGYIGSHTVKELLKKSYEVTVFDNLVYGHRESIKCPLIVGDLLNKEQINEIFQKEKFDGVVHFAAYSLVGESMKDPAKYFENNTIGGLNLLEAMRLNGVTNIVFSSTSAVYGFPEELPVTEEESKKPVSVYGESKLAFETILKWYDQIHGVKNICLRYFNACGASPEGEIGEDHKPETHLIPVAMQVALGQRDKFIQNGDDFPTPDRTTIRDYIHVCDLADVHVKSLEHLKKEKKSNYFNVGTGNGYSIKQIVDLVKKITGVNFPIEIGPRREGDPAAIYGNNAKIKEVLNWEPKYSDLETVIKTAWNWHKNHPNGY